MPEGPGLQAQPLRRNALASVAGRGASALLWVLVTPYALSRLGQERFAVWSLFFVFGGYVATLDLGMANTVARFVAVGAARGDRGRIVSVVRRSLSVSAALGLVWGVACMLLRAPLMRAFHVPGALEAEVARSLIVFAFALAAFSVTQVLNGSLIGFQRLDLSNLTFLAGLLVNTAVLVAALAAGAGLPGAAAAMVIGHVCTGGLSGLLARRLVRRMPQSSATEAVTWSELLRFSGAVQATAACAVGQLQVAKVLLGVLGRLAWVTQFELGFRVANAVWSLPTLVQAAVIPASAHASAAGGRADVRAVYDWACRWIFALAGVVLAGLWLAAPAIVTLWLGPGQEAAVAVTRALSVTFAVATLSGPATAVARGGGWPLLETWNFAAALVLNVASGLWLVPRFGPPGATLAMTISYGVAGAWLLVVMHRLLEVRGRAWLLKVAAPRFLLPAGVALAVDRVWPVAIPAGRAEALRVALIQGAVFLPLVAALSWPTGDARALWARLRARRLVAEPAPGRGS